MSIRIGLDFESKIDMELLSAGVSVLEDDSVPFLIGFEDVLTGARLVSDYGASRSYLDWSKY